MRLVYDVECYPNYFSICARDLDTREIHWWEKYNDRETESSHDLLEDFMSRATMITFNGLRYDDFMVSGYLSGFSNKELFNLSKSVISNRDPLFAWTGWRTLARTRGLVRHESKMSVDIFNIPKGVHSLKIYAGRIGFQKLQELPIHWETELTDEMVAVLRMYNINDVDATEALYLDQRPQVLLRNNMSKQYGIDLRSKSDAQIAESVIKKELLKQGITPIKGETLDLPDEYRYTPPGYLSFNNATLAQRYSEVVEDYVFTMGKDGKMKAPRAMASPFEIYGNVYKMGVGGLHSQEARRSITANDDEILCDIDVASYYPSMIRNEKYAPSQYGSEAFLNVYGGVVDRRLAAKAAGNKVMADSLKIVINASFGKFGNKYSCLFSPDLLIHTTITGQLLLLKLIEMMEDAGIKIVSANTDGVICRFHRDMELDFYGVKEEWESLTNLVLERTDYLGVYNQSVNSYFTVKPDGTFKGKSFFAPPSADISPAGSIVAEAVMTYVAGGKHYAETIMDCTDITKFCYLRKVTGGAEYDMTDVGSTVRWYVGKEFKLPMTYIKSGNNVPATHNAVLALDLPDGIPDDLSRTHYVQEAQRCLLSIGWENEL